MEIFEKKIGTKDMIGWSVVVEADARCAHEEVSVVEERLDDHVTTEIRLDKTSVPRILSRFPAFLQFHT